MDRINWNNAALVAFLVIVWEFSLDVVVGPIGTRPPWLGPTGAIVVGLLTAGKYPIFNRRRG